MFDRSFWGINEAIAGNSVQSELHIDRDLMLRAIVIDSNCIEPRHKVIQELAIQHTKRLASLRKDCEMLCFEIGPKKVTHPII